MTPAAIERRVEASDTCAARLRAAGVQLEEHDVAEAADDIHDLVDVLDLGQVSVAAGWLHRPPRRPRSPGRTPARCRRSC